MKISKSNDEEIPRINAIIAASKSIWKYDERYLKAAIPLLLINKDWISQHAGYSLYEDDLEGFMGIEAIDDHWHLEHLWIAPNSMRKGLGRKAIDYARELARNAGIQEIYLFPDPPAEGFYEKLGAIYTGKIVPSRVECGPTFREMVIKNKG